MIQQKGINRIIDVLINFCAYFFRVKNLGLTLGYLDNIMICIDAAIKGSFTGLTVSVSVSVEEFLLRLNTIMLGLSQDTLNIDFNLYLEFITLYFEGEISQYQIDALTRKVLIFLLYIRH